MEREPEHMPYVAPETEFPTVRVGKTVYEAEKVVFVRQRVDQALPVVTQQEYPEGNSANIIRMERLVLPMSEALGSMAAD